MITKVINYKKNPFCKVIGDRLQKAYRNKFLRRLSDSIEQEVGPESTEVLIPAPT